MASDFAKQQTQERLERLVHCLKEVSDGAGEDSVHDLRVSIRRFKAALRIFRPELKQKAVKKIRHNLDVVMQSAGVVRDRDVIAKLALKSEPARSEIVAALRQQREDGAAQLKLGAGKILKKDPAANWARRLGL